MPDPPLPEPEPESMHVVSYPNRDRARALAASEELSRTYPDFVEALGSRPGSGRRVPTPRFPGTALLPSPQAPRACELTNWEGHTLKFWLPPSPRPEILRRR